jgi:myosin heavy subunit
MMGGDGDEEGAAGRRGRDNVVDIVDLPVLEEEDVIDLFKLRFRDNKIYTRAASVMISLNPFQEILVDGRSIYSPQVQLRYATSLTRKELDSLPPVRHTATLNITGRHTGSV